MSFSWTIDGLPPPGNSFRTMPFDPDRTRVIVPTFRDWDAARHTVKALLRCKPRPAEIVLVNDNAQPGAPGWTARLPIRLVDYPGNRGPAFARNAGAALPTGRKIDTLCFTDSGCERAEDFFLVLADASAYMPSTTVAMGGPVVGAVQSHRRNLINWYMTVEGILNPPRDRYGPQAIVTANAVVRAAAFRAVGGFDITYPFAAGEDIDLGLKLRSLGPIGWVEGASVTHRFLESTHDFRRRFLRYGAGTAHLEHRWGLRSLRPVRFTAHVPSMQRLADLQISSMQEGYDRHFDSLRRKSA